MIHRKRPSTGRELLGPCLLGAGDGRREDPVDDGALPCPTCRVPCSALEETARSLAAGVSQTWDGISAAVSARRTKRDDALDQLAGIGAAGGADADRDGPNRTLVVSPSAKARAVLAAPTADVARRAGGGW